MGKQEELYDPESNIHLKALQVGGPAPAQLELLAVSTPLAGRSSCMISERLHCCRRDEVIIWQCFQSALQILVDNS
jgi:hypothetical protein